MAISNLNRYRSTVYSRSFSNLLYRGKSKILGGLIISGSLVAMLGFTRIFLYSAWFFGPALLILYLIRTKKIAKKGEKND